MVNYIKDLLFQYLLFGLSQLFLNLGHRWGGCSWKTLTGPHPYWEPMAGRQAASGASPQPVQNSRPSLLPPLITITWISVFSKLMTEISSSVQWQESLSCHIKIYTNAMGSQHCQENRINFHLYSCLLKKKPMAWLLSQREGRHRGHLHTDPPRVLLCFVYSHDTFLLTKKGLLLPGVGAPPTEVIELGDTETRNKVSCLT